MNSPPLILIVDDTKTNIDILRNTLSDSYDISVALSGRDALEIVNDDKPDLILLDIMMPDIDGYEVCRILKKNTETANIPVIFVTALTELSNETLGLSLGAVDYITKPINPDLTMIRIKNQIELKYHREGLEQLVEKKTRQLAAEKLKAEEASRAKSSFIRNMSHELRTPLNHIIGFSDLLMEESESAEEASMIYEAGKSLLTIIERIIDLSDGKKEHVPIDKSPVFITEQILQITQKEEQLQTEQKNSVSINISQKLDEFNTDPQMFSIIFQNIINNAFKFTKNGNIHVTAVNTLKNNQQWLKIVIKDSGCGMQQEQTKGIFDAFTQVDDSESRSYEGMGLGLAISKLYCERLGGFIEVKSGLEMGSEFSVFFPY
jgi:two-component system, sensor histidine kinase and response regulator